MNNASLEHTVVTLNGHRVLGWAADANALDMPAINLAETEVGADGQMVVSSTGNKGGPVGIKLQSVSPSAVYFFKQAEVAKQGGSVVWNGSIRNAQTGATTRLERGVLKTVPGGQSLGNTTAPMLEFVFEFESIKGNYDGAKVQNPPVTI